jgi:hypothetical protein
MIIQLIPDTKNITGFDIPEIHRFIREFSPKVQFFWNSLIQIEDVAAVPTQNSLIDSCLIRIDELELLFLYCDQYFRQNKTSLSPDFDNAVKNLSDVKFEDYDELLYIQSEQNLSQQLLISRNSYGLTLSRHFMKLLNLEK